MKSFIAGIKKAAVQAKGKLAIVGAAGAGALMLPGISHAALSTEETALVTAVTTKLDDLITAVRTIATSNIGLISAMVVVGLIVMYLRSAGR